MATRATSDEDPVRLADRVRELEGRLRRERSRAAGLERGITALSDSSQALRRENQRLRAQLEGEAVHDLAS